MFIFNCEYIFILFINIISVLISIPVYKRYLYTGKIQNAIGFLVIPVLVYVLFWGFRVDVGTDYEAYCNAFKTISNGFSANYEFGFLALCEFLSSLGFTSISLFVVISFIQIVCILCLPTNNTVYEKVFDLFFAYTCTVFFFQNGLRQSVAMSMFLFFLAYFRKNYKHLLMACLAVFLGFSFHKSIVFPAAIVALIYFLPRYILPTLPTIIIIGITNIIGVLYPSLINDVIGSISIVQDVYGNEAQSYFIYGGVAQDRGVGWIVIMLLSFIPILYKDHIVNKNDNSYLFYWMFLIGESFRQFFASNLAFNRVNMYFLLADIYMYSKVCGYFSKKNTNHVLIYIIVAFYLFGYVTAIFSGDNGVGVYENVLF